jgi:hypothetical protein
MNELAKELFRLEFLSENGFEFEKSSRQFEGFDVSHFEILQENEIITHKGFTERPECSCGGLFEETFEDGVYSCPECGNFEKIHEERRIYKVDCESIFIAISESLQKIASKFEELESFVLHKKGFLQNQIMLIGSLKNLDLEIYFLHKQHHAQDFKKQKENTKTLIFTLDGSVSNFADYYISCGEILNDEGSISLAKINVELFAVLYEICKEQGLAKNAAKFYVLHMLKSGSKKYKFDGGRKAFIQDMTKNFNISKEYAEKLWIDFMR